MQKAKEAEMLKYEKRADYLSVFVQHDYPEAALNNIIIKEFEEQMLKNKRA